MQAWHGPQLLLDGLERTPQRNPSRQRIVEINPPSIEAHGIETGEPAHRPRQVNAREHAFLAAMPFQIQQQGVTAARSLLLAPPPWT